MKYRALCFSGMKVRQLQRWLNFYQNVFPSDYTVGEYIRLDKPLRIASKP